MAIAEWLLIGGGLSLAVFLIVDHVLQMVRGRSCITKEGEKDD